MSDKKNSPPPQTFGISSTYSISANITSPSPPTFDADAAFKTAEELVQKQQFGEAHELCKKILSVNPQHSRALHILGFLELSRGQVNAALDALKQSEALGNDNPLMYMHLGITLSTMGEIDQALARFIKAVEGAPNLAPAHFNLGLTLSKVRRNDEAEKAFLTTVELDPQHADAWVELSSVRMKLAVEPEILLETLDRALTINAGHIGALNQKAVILNSQDRVEDAIQLLEQALSLAPDRPEVLVNYGDVQLSRDATRSIDVFRKALTVDPAFPEARAKLAEALERINRVVEARAEARAVLATEPGSVLARLTLARCDQRDKDYDAALRQLDALLEENLNAALYASVQKARAIILDRQNEYPLAFRAATDANARLLENKPLTDKGQKSVYAPLRNHLTDITRERVNGWPREFESAYPDPTFFVGFPRSGTTLMEQILRAHPRFVSQGEVEWIRRTIDSLESARGTDLDQLTDPDIENLRATYWRQAVDFHGEKVLDFHLIDKMPLNITHLGFIRRIFPGTKVLVALRDPRDCILSGYMQNFHRVHAMDQFLTLETAAKFYSAVMNLWLHYRETLDMDVFEYRYEDLVTSPRPMLEAAIEFLGEDWDEAVLHHEKTVSSSAVTVATPSLRDVAEPIHVRAAKRWPKYKEELASTFPDIQKFISTFGYDAD